MNGNRLFLAVITILVTIAMGLGAFALERINNLYETKASIREVEQMREARKEINKETKRDLKEIRADLTQIKIALGLPRNEYLTPYRR